MAPTGPLSWFAGTALVLFLPGDAVRRLIGSAATQVSWFVLAVAGSLTVTVAAGLVVDRFHVGLTRTSMVVALWSVTSALDLAVVIRAVLRPVPATSTPVVEPAGEVPPPESVGRHRVVLGYVAAATMFAAFTALAVGLSVQSAEHRDDQASAVALSIQPTAADTATIEVDNGSQHAADLQLVVAAGAQQLTTRTLRLASHKTSSVVVSAAGVPAGTRLTATLLGPGSDPVRSVWLVVSGGSP